MPTVRIPLVGSFNQRSIDGSGALNLNEDQRFLNATFNVVQNPVTGKATLYVEKRPGWAQDSQVSTGIASSGLIKPQLFSSPLTAFGDVSSNIYIGTINVGVLSARALHFTETLINASSSVLIKASDGTGWYYTTGAKDVLTYTGFTSSGVLTVSTIADTTGLYPGQLITGNTIGAGARVSTVNFATSTITLTVANTANSTGAIITKEPIAKILSANFLTTGTYISAFAVKDGFHVYTTDDGYLNNSDLNTFLAYQASGRVAAQASPDPAVGVAVQKNAIAVFGLKTKEIFQNAGNAQGSPFNPVPQMTEYVGCLDQRSITQIEDDIFWVSSPADGDVGVYRMTGYSSVRISPPNVDRIIGTAATNGAIYAASFRLGGYNYAAFAISIASDTPASKVLLETGDFILLETGDKILEEGAASQAASFVRLLVYNIKLNIWSEWDCNQVTFVDSVGSGTNNQIIATSRFNTSGKIYRIDPVSLGAVYQDDGANYSTEIRTAKLDFGTNNRKYIDEVELIADTVSSGTCTLYFSDDDYVTWSGGQTFDMSQQGKKVTRLGAHYNSRAYKLVHSNNGPFRAEALEITYRVGKS
jgi:hypothetical protein